MNVTGSLSHCHDVTPYVMWNWDSTLVGSGLIASILTGDDLIHSLSIDSSELAIPVSILYLTTYLDDVN